MGRRRSCKNEINKGSWSKEEDEALFNYVTLHGEGKWQEVAKSSGLKRCGKSCRYRYLNYLKPDIKRGDISKIEEDLIIRLHQQLGNRWAQIAKWLPGRTDIEIKNYWKIYLSKKLHNQHIHTENSDEDVLGKFLLENSEQNEQIIDNILNSKIEQVEQKKEQQKKKDDENMGRHGFKGAWSRKEDEILFNHVTLHGEGQWEKIAQKTGLKRCGKSCRHRYLHYLKPGIKRGNITKDEEEMIIKLHHLHGNRWTSIAKKLPGRTDSEIKNYWHAYLSKKLQTHPESSVSPKSYQHKIKDENFKQISCARNTEILEDNIMGSSESNHNTDSVITDPLISPNLFQIEYDAAFLDDFLFKIFQNDQFGNDMNSMIPQVEDNMDGSSSSTNHHQFQLSEEDLDLWISSDGFPLFD